MTTLPSNRGLITRFTFFALIFTLIAVIVGCYSHTRVRKELATDPCWKEIQQGQSQQICTPKPTAKPEVPQEDDRPDEIY